MHLVGFTIEIYYDARHYERQIKIYVELKRNIQHLVFYKCAESRGINL